MNTQQRKRKIVFEDEPILTWTSNTHTHSNSIGTKEEKKHRINDDYNNGYTYVGRVTDYFDGPEVEDGKNGKDGDNELKHSQDEIRNQVQTGIRGLFANENLLKGTILADYPGKLMSDREHEMMVDHLKDLHTNFTGEEYALENLNLLNLAKSRNIDNDKNNNSTLSLLEYDPQGNLRYIYSPQDPMNGEILREYANHPALLINEPSNRYNDKHRLIKNKQTPNAVLATNFETNDLEWVTIKPVKRGAEILGCYGPEYEHVRNRFHYRTTCPKEQTRDYGIWCNKLYSYPKKGFESIEKPPRTERQYSKSNKCKGSHWTQDPETSEWIFNYGGPTR